jgi:hypothetical protein
MTDSVAPRSNEALALLWAYELHRENKYLSKGLRKANRCLAKLDRPQPSPNENENNPHPKRTGSMKQKKT